jgi:hypothetical protein
MYVFVTGPRVAAVVLAWSLAVVVALETATGAIPGRLAFLVCYLGFLVAYLYVDPSRLNRGWRRGLGLVALAGGIGFLAVAGLDVVDLLET